MSATTTQRSAYSIRSLAVEWDCSESAIYDLIRGGKLRFFKIGKRGIRVSAEEKQRWERDAERANDTDRETVASVGGAARPLPSSQIRALASVKG